MTASCTAAPRAASPISIPTADVATGRAFTSQPLDVGGRRWRAGPGGGGVRGDSDPLDRRRTDPSPRVLRKAAPFVVGDVTLRRVRASGCPFPGDEDRLGMGTVPGGHASRHPVRARTGSPPMRTPVQGRAQARSGLTSSSRRERRGLSARSGSSVTVVPYGRCRPAGRAHVPAILKREILVEAGHRCAIHTCRATPVEIAHIVPWSRVGTHEADKLIALCPTCHVRFDAGQIDHLAMVRYKHNLRRDPILPGSDAISAYLGFPEALRSWHDLVGRIEMGSVADTLFEESRADLIHRARSWQRVVAMSLRKVGAARPRTPSFDLASRPFDQERGWVEDVLAGLWPDSSLAAPCHDLSELSWDVVEDAFLTELDVVAG
ncbi:HNH endonuclease [Embleya sp. NPDC008237]|uniref:HNH endonuclease n=1 Tax=Embleya sp. NPDC008237 TaxID=3363978 RepID=UPI0036E9A530